MKELYLDANAHVPMGHKALKAYSDYNSSRSGWGHALAPSLPGRESSSKLEEARGKIAYLLGAENPSNIIITSTCTQACEWGLSLLNDKYTKLVLQSGVEHSAIYQKLEDLEDKFAIDTFLLNSDGVVIPNEKKIYHSVCVHVQNEIGTIQPIEKLKRDNCLLFSDMCQSPGKVSINLKEMPVDIGAFGAHKWGGSAGVGLLYIKDLSLYKEFGTGSRYFNDRSGTMDVGAIIASAVALEDSLLNMPERLVNMREFQFILENRLEDMGLTVMGRTSLRVPNTTFVQIPGIAFNILADLSKIGIYVGMGSACGSMHSGPSQTMNSMGIKCEAHDFLRISQHGNYGKNEAIYVADAIKKLVGIYRRG